jgi:hypothetical protein
MGVGAQHDMPAPTSVSAVGTASRDVFFATKGNTTIATWAAGHTQIAFVDKSD